MKTFCCNGKDVGVVSRCPEARAGGGVRERRSQI